MGNYLYNGVELPALPEWDKETYPYAVISTYTPMGGLLGYYLIACNQPLYAHYGAIYAFWKLGGTPIQTLCQTRDTEPSDYAWKNDCYGLYEGETDEIWASPLTSEYTHMFELPIWSNYDVERVEQFEDNAPIPSGIVYLAASEPVPVTDSGGNTESPDLSALLMGYRVGQMIRQLRGKADSGESEVPEETIVATFADGVLYIKNASAILTDGVLEVK